MIHDWRRPCSSKNQTWHSSFEVAGSLRVESRAAILGRVGAVLRDAAAGSRREPNQLRKDDQVRALSVARGSVPPSAGVISRAGAVRARSPRSAPVRLCDLAAIASAWAV